MAKFEIERRFLFDSDKLLSSQQVDGSGNYLQIEQGYLSLKPAVRVRIQSSPEGKHKSALITIKGSGLLKREEYEYKIPVKDAECLMTMCGHRVINKFRASITYAGKVWDVDAFKGRHLGLFIAEIELSSEKEKFRKPPWLGKEITDDPRYSNAKLSVCRKKFW